MFKAIILDRDGVLVRCDGPYYNKTLEDIKLYEDVGQLSRLARLGFKFFIATNQAWITDSVSDDTHENCVETVIKNIKLYYKINTKLTELLKQYGIEIVDIATSHTNNFAWRKPNSGLITALAARYNIDLHSSYFVGDSPYDRDAAAGVNMSFIPLLREGNKNSEELKDMLFKCFDMQDVVNEIINIDKFGNYATRTFNDYSKFLYWSFDTDMEFFFSNK